MNDAALGRAWAVLGMALSLLRNYDPFKAPSRLNVLLLMERFDKAFGAPKRDYGRLGEGRTMKDIEKRRSDRFLFLFIAGMWFQDLFSTTSGGRRWHHPCHPDGRDPSAPTTPIGWRRIVGEDAHDSHLTE